MTHEIGDQRYQEKVVQALLQDYKYAEQLHDVLKPDFFSQEHLKQVVRILFNYREKYKAFPSPDTIADILNKEGTQDIVRSRIGSFMEKIKETPLNGDMGYIQETSIDFCRRQSLLEGINNALEEIDTGNFDGIWKIITDAASKGATRDEGHDYLEGFDYRNLKCERDPVALPWKALNDVMGGGPDRQSLITFIGPTGSGKTHFLTNVSASGIEQGLNVVYISLEIADYKIGLRHDAYFSGVAINDVPGEVEKVKAEVRAAVPKGKLFIKEFPTRGATVNTIRSYLQRLKSMKQFTPDMLVLDYAALLRAPKVGDKGSHDLESVYAELRGLSQEMNILIVTADQTNRGGLNQEIVTLESIAENFNRATVCDAIVTISRTVEDKSQGTGRLFLAKSRFGPDGIVFPFLINTAKVKIRVLRESQTAGEVHQESEQNEKKRTLNRLKELKDKK